MLNDDIMLALIELEAELQVLFISFSTKMD